MNRSTLNGKRGRSGHKVKLNSLLRRGLKRTKRDTSDHRMSSDDNGRQYECFANCSAADTEHIYGHNNGSICFATNRESDDDIEIVAVISAPTAQTTGAATAGPSIASLPPPVLSLPPVVSSPMSSPSLSTSVTTVDTAIQSVAVAQTVPNEGRRLSVVSDTINPTVTPVPSDTEMDPDIDDSGDLLYASDDDLTADGQYSDT
ncbi:unnamed protein product, partial [Medioppia subpectinata]